jgi:hypothetical protein
VDRSVFIVFIVGFRRLDRTYAREFLSSKNIVGAGSPTIIAT